MFFHCRKKEERSIYLKPWKRISQLANLLTCSHGMKLRQGEHLGFLHLSVHCFNHLVKSGCWWSHRWSSCLHIPCLPATPSLSHSPSASGAVSVVLLFDCQSKA